MKWLSMIWMNKVTTVIRYYGNVFKLQILYRSDMAQDFK